MSYPTFTVKAMFGKDKIQPAVRNLCRNGSLYVSVKVMLDTVTDKPLNLLALHNRTIFLIQLKPPEGVPDKWAAFHNVV